MKTPISLWMDDPAIQRQVRPRLESTLSVDVAIIGAGFTGLWTAYYLKKHNPSLTIAIVEAEYAGFGASGRNGGWLIGGLMGEDQLLSTLPEDERRNKRQLLFSIPDEVAAVLQQEQIDCHYRKGGVIYAAARYSEQEVWLRKWLDELYNTGCTYADFAWLTPEALSDKVNVSRGLGAIYSPHCATIQPARLVQGLGEAVERIGVTVYEQTPVTDWQPGRLTTPAGQVEAHWIVPAVEGYATTLSTLGRYQIPVQSMIVATAPISEAIWQSIGLHQGEAFADNSRMITYAQRTKDNRLVFGTRGGYRFGSRLRHDFQLSAQEVAEGRTLLEALFPVLKNIELTHGWGGNLGMARAFQPHMLCDEKNGIALAGGYGGEGVGASNLAGRTLADLITGKTTQLTDQPWVIKGSVSGHLRRWEPEPLRWLGYRLILAALSREEVLLSDPGTSPWRRRLATNLSNKLEGLME